MAHSDPYFYMSGRELLERAGDGDRKARREINRRAEKRRAAAQLASPPKPKCDLEQKAAAQKRDPFAHLPAGQRAFLRDGFRRARERPPSPEDR